MYPAHRGFTRSDDYGAGLSADTKRSSNMHAAKIGTSWSFDTLRDERLRQLAAYWESLRHGRAVPCRTDVIRLR